MTFKKMRVAIAFAVALGSSLRFAPPAQAAPDCRGASGVIRCNADRISCLAGGEWATPQSCL